jgi:hypothetical protein
MGQSVGCVLKRPRVNPMERAFLRWREVMPPMSLTGHEQ